LINFYAFLKAQSVLHLSGGPKYGSIVFIVFLIFCILLAHFFERLGMSHLSRFLFWTGYIWGGFIFLFFSFSIPVEILKFCMRGVEVISKQNILVSKIFPYLAFYFPLILSITANVYGYFEARKIKIEHITVTTPKFPSGISRVRIVQVSDIHYGATVGRRWVEKIFSIVQGLKPDILVSTGDMIDSTYSDPDFLKRIVSGVKARLGKFAVTGNHEFYAGIEKSVKYHQECGFRVLRHEMVCVDGILNLIGVDDDENRRLGEKDTEFSNLFKGEACEGKFNILLKHKPFSEKSLAGNIDLQLSGHTHGGQIFPWSLVVRLVYGSGPGLRILPDGNFIYVSRGTGVWGPPVRVLSPPEITVIDIIHGNKVEVKKNNF